MRVGKHWVSVDQFVSREKSGLRVDRFPMPQKNRLEVKG